MKILLFGGTGLIGNALLSVLTAHNDDVFAPYHRHCDVTNKSDIQDILATRRFDAIINATGYTAVDKAEEPGERERCFLMNEMVPAQLAAIAKEHTTPLVHISTDYVFDGSHKTPYTEDDTPNPRSIYGKSKLAGEVAVISSGCPALIARTAWPFGPGGKNFVDTMLALSLTHNALEVVNDQTGSPTFTLDFAERLRKLISLEATGIYHLTNAGSATWFDVAQKIFTILGVPQKVVPITTQTLNRPAPRPAYSVLTSKKMGPLRPWDEALAAYLMEKELVLKA